jgi:hypothetical protein
LQALRLLLLLLILPVLLFCCALTMLRAPLPASLEGARNQGAAIATGLVGAGYLVSVVVYVITSLWRASRRLDPVLTALGFAAKPYALFGRQYRGFFHGRQVQVQYLPAQASRSARLDVTVDADLVARIAIGWQRPLLDCRDCPRIELNAQGLSQLEVYAQEEAQARSLLANVRARRAIQHLMDARSSSGQPEIYVQPDRIWLRARPWQIARGQIEAWLDDLLALAEAGEGT